MAKKNGIVRSQQLEILAKGVKQAIKTVDEKPLPLATKDRPGIVQVFGEGVYVDDRGYISVPVAGADRYGLVKINGVRSLANAQIYSAAMQFLGYELKEDRKSGESPWIDPDGTGPRDILTIAGIGQWIHEHPDALEILEALTRRASEEYLTEEEARAMVREIFNINTEENGE